MAKALDGVPAGKRPFVFTKCERVWDENRQIGKSLKFVGQQSIQLHGGIGMTQEYKIGHYFKRLTMIDLAFGDADYHLRRLAAAGGLS